MHVQVNLWLQLGSLTGIDSSNISETSTIKMAINKFPVVRFWLILDIMCTSKLVS